MTAICKVIPIHSKNIAPVIDYVKDMKKSDMDYATTHSESDYMKDVFDYTQNPLKTQFGIDDGHEQLLITGVNCRPDTAVMEFAESRQKYLGKSGTEKNYRPFEMTDPKTGEKKMVLKEPVQAIHLIQSFSETNLDPRVVHQIGKELAERLGDNCQAVISTHMNKEHTHNHIVINSYNMDGKGKMPCNRTKLMEIRKLSDDIQREYGIEVKFASPEQQLRLSKIQGRHSSYHETVQAKRGYSWKLQMMTEMAAIREMAETRDEFVELMNDYGYTIVKESEDSITWMNHEAGKKIRDSTLGEEFTIGYMYGDKHIPIPVKEVSKEQETTPLGTISISRYDWDGRRRSELEMLVRKVIAIIQRVQNMFERIEAIETTHTPKYKLQLMDKALNTIRSMGIENKAELQALTKETVSTYNHYKSELAHMKLDKEWNSALSSFVTAMDEAKAALGGHLPGQEKINLPAFTPKEIRKNRAKQFPMSAGQKKELYYKCQSHPDWHLAYKYEQLTSLDAKKVIDFFDGRGSLPTELLLTTPQYEKRKAENYRKAKNKSKSVEPLKPSMEELDIKFQEYIKDKPIEHRIFFERLRSQMIFLSSIGIDPYNTDGCKELISQFDAKYETTLSHRDEYGQKYKELLKLQQAISYAETPSFIYGAMWDARKNEPVLVQENDERDIKTNSQDNPSKKTQKQFSKNNTDLPRMENL